MVMRSFRAVLACALLAGAVAVPASAAPPTTVNGRVLDTAGRPVRNATVKFTRDSDPSVITAITCLIPFFMIPEHCRPSDVVGRTDASGRYSLRVKPSSWVGQPGERTLTITEPGGTAALPGAVTRVNIYWAQKTLAVPDMRLWQASPSVTGATPLAVTVHTDPLPSSLGRTAEDYAPSVYLLQNGGQVWKYAESTDDRPADGRTVEHGSNAVQQFATAMVGHGYKVLYWSRAVPLGAAAVTPVSRGAACSLYGEGDALVPLASCAFTDGRLAVAPDYRYLRPAKACLYPSAKCAHPRWVLLDLGSPRVVQAAVVRGCTVDPNDDLGTFDAEVSVDGATWAPLLASNPWSALVYAPPTPTRYVRVNLWSCEFPPSEVSVFGVA